MAQPPVERSRKRHRSDAGEPDADDAVDGTRRPARRSDSASTWKKRQRKGSISSGGWYNAPPNGGYDAVPADMMMPDDSSHGRKEMSRPPPPINEEEVPSWHYHRNGSAMYSQGGRHPAVARGGGFPVMPTQQIHMARDPSPLNGEPHSQSHTPCTSLHLFSQ
eukprot:Blabericola_migrator_1__3209@NODE_1944_length_3529_cov_107_922299_g1242_i0_p4_GENE_NODE_1944_length_3529_cov_107_922299_g1242_i0NODE_1944_length_3529_cov_107_922299_g1242_i0_p4_ORF_typecomplete_len163_score26_35_NODE_1944_length_3529_cov_107_922299_g1242_i015132001